MAAVQRVRSRAQFQALLGRRPCARSAHFALHRLQASHEPSAAFPALSSPDLVWMGALVPKRWARRAVRRNLIRRQIHAVGAEWAAAGGGAARSGAWLIRLRSGFSAAAFPSARSDALKQAVRTELQQLLRDCP